MAKNGILKKACFDEKKGVKILHIKAHPTKWDISTAIY